MTDIPLRWVGTDATGAAASSVKKNIDSVGKAASGAQGGVKGLSDAMSKMAPAGKSAQGALSGMESAARQLLGGLGGVAAAMGVGAVVGFGGMMVGAAVDMGKAAEASDRLRSAMDGLAQKAGSSSAEIITRLQQASGGAIAEYDLMLAANKAMMLGVAQSADEMGKLMEIARVRGGAMGLSATQAFNDLVTGLGRGSALILDNLGIIVDAEATNEAYAASVGKTVSQLSEQEKKQALVNATLKEATGQALPVASAYERMGAAMADMKVELGDLFGPAITAAANMIAQGIGAINDSFEMPALDAVNEKLQTLSATMGDLTANDSGVTNEQIEVARQMVEQYESLARVLRGDLSEANAELATAQREYNTAVQEGYDLKGYTDELNRQQGIVDQLRADIDAATVSAANWNHAIGEATRIIGEQNAQLLIGGYGWRAQQGAMEAAAASAAKTAQQIEASNAALAQQFAGVAAIQETYNGLIAVQDGVAAAAERAGLSMAQTDAVVAQAAAQYAILTENGYTSAEAIDMVTGAMDAQIERLPALGELLSNLATKLATEIPAAAAVATEAVANMFASVMAGMAEMGQQLMRSGPGSTTGDPGRVTRGRQTTLVNSPNIGASTLDQFDGFTLLNTKASDAARAAAKLATSGGGAAGKLGDLAGKAGDLAGKFQGLLDKIPGLKGTSEVSEKQMEDAKLGIPQNFADDYLRRLTDEVLNGVDWAGVDIGDAAQRAGIDPSLPAQTILAMFKNAWADSSLFANPANLDLINMDAVKAGLTQANNAASGKANIDALFGIGDDATIAAVASLGLKVQSGLSEWLTENGAPDAGAKLAAALGTGVTTAGIALDGGLDTWVGSDAASLAATAIGGRLSQMLSDRTIIKPTIQMPEVPAGTDTSAAAGATSGRTPPPAFASGTTYFGGGWAKVHRDEVVRLASGPVYNARQSSKFAAATVVVNAVINNKLDEAQFAQMLRSAMRKAQVRS